MYPDKQKKYYIEREQRDAKGNIKVIKRDFFDDLPGSVCNVLDNICWRWRNYDWFEEAWNKYREHVINAAANNTAIKAPGFIFNSYIDDQIKEDFLNRDDAEVFHSELDLTELFHHGIKGQKWGIRRFQNPDGSLTPEGKLRYNSDGSIKDPAKMTDEELRKANQRMVAEQQFQQLTGTTQPGRAMTRDNAIKIGATFVGTAALPLLYNSLKNGSPLASGSTTKERVGKTVVQSLLSGGIGALIAATSTLGGEAKRIKD